MSDNDVVIDSSSAWRLLALTFGIITILMAAGCAGFWNKSPPSGEKESVRASAEAPSEETTASALEEQRPSTESEAARQKTAEPSPPAELNQPAITKTGREPVVTETGSESRPKETAHAKDVATPVTPESSALPEKEDKLSAETESGGSVTKLESVPVKPVVSSPVSPEPTTKAIPAQVDKRAAPPLDLDLLEKRLKETSAIGFFTKIALKNQVNELLDKFRAFYEGRSNFSLAQLRQPFELLIMKVLALLQDSDQQLANDILASREAIWDILSDREKFAKI